MQKGAFPDDEGDGVDVGKQASSTDDLGDATAVETCDIIREDVSLITFSCDDSPDGVRLGVPAGDVSASIKLKLKDGGLIPSDCNISPDALGTSECDLSLGD